MIAVDIGVCTYRRVDLVQQCIRALALQRLAADVAMRIIVADNNPRPLARQAIAELATQLGLDIAYVHAPHSNISIARNACIDAARGDWLAFIDDDEEARPDWLGRLLACARAERADVVFGVSEPVMPPGSPGWSVSGEFHANRMGPNDKPHNGYTCNVLMRRAAIGRLRFDPALGRTGGEDTLLFHQAHLGGLRFAYAPDAVVTESIHIGRASIGWVLRRRFRSGQIHHRLQPDGSAATRVALAAAAKAAWCAAMAALALGSGSRMMRHAARGVFHAGVVAAALGRSPIEEYAVPAPAPV